LDCADLWTLSVGTAIVQIRFLSSNRSADLGDDSWGTRKYGLFDEHELIGSLTLTLTEASSTQIGVEIGPILTVDWMWVDPSRRHDVRPVLTIVRFISDEAERLVTTRSIVGVAFSPDNPKVLKFVKRTFRLVQLGEPYWFVIKLDRSAFPVDE
jgi:hypothetical protein